jgi:hypothetical protein
MRNDRMKDAPDEEWFWVRPRDLMVEVRVGRKGREVGVEGAFKAGIEKGAEKVRTRPGLGDTVQAQRVPVGRSQRGVEGDEKNGIREEKKKDDKATPDSCTQ